MGSLRVGHDWAASLSLFTFLHWRKKWQPTPVFLPGESQGQGSLVGCRLWGRDWQKWLSSHYAIPMISLFACRFHLSIFSFLFAFSDTCFMYVSWYLYWLNCFLCYIGSVQTTGTVSIFWQNPDSVVNDGCSSKQSMCVEGWSETAPQLEQDWSSLATMFALALVIPAHRRNTEGPERRFTGQVCKRHSLVLLVTHWGTFWECHKATFRERDGMYGISEQPYAQL